MMRGPSMSLGEFLLTLSKDMDLLRSYVDDPYPLFEKYEVSEEHREILLSNDIDRLYEALRDEHPEEAHVYVAFGPLRGPTWTSNPNG